MFLFCILITKQAEQSLIKANFASRWNYSRRNSIQISTYFNLVESDVENIYAASGMFSIIINFIYHLFFASNNVPHIFPFLGKATLFLARCICFYFAFADAIVVVYKNGSKFSLSNIKTVNWVESKWYQTPIERHWIKVLNVSNVLFGFWVIGPHADIRYVLQ